jgi:hypothetical protein
MPQPKTSNSKPKIEVILLLSDPKKSVVRYDTEERPTDLRTLYLGNSGFARLGNPKAIKVTVEVHEA